jgi:Flp pilus assembly protein TadD
MRIFSGVIFAIVIMIAVASTSVAAQGLDELIARGDRHFHVGNYAAAAATFADAAQRHRGEPIPRLAKGHSLFAMRLFEEASRSLQDGIRLLPAWHRSGIDLRGFFRDPGEFDANLRVLSEWVRQRPSATDLIFLQAYCLHFSGRRERARALFHRVLSLDPDHGAARTFVERRGRRTDAS